MISLSFSAKESAITLTFAYPLNFSCAFNSWRCLISFFRLIFSERSYAEGRFPLYPCSVISLASVSRSFCSSAMILSFYWSSFLSPSSSSLVSTKFSYLSKRISFFYSSSSVFINKLSLLLVISLYLISTCFSMAESLSDKSSFYLRSSET